MRGKIEEIVEEKKKSDRGERKMNESEETEEIPPPPPTSSFPAARRAVLPNCKPISDGRPDDVRYTHVQEISSFHIALIREEDYWRSLSDRWSSPYVSGIVPRFFTIASFTALANPRIISLIQNKACGVSQITMMVYRFILHPGQLALLPGMKLPLGSLRPGLKIPIPGQLAPHPQKS